MDAVMEADLRRSVLEEVRINTGTAPPDPRAGSDLPPGVPEVWGSVLIDEAQDLSPMAWRMIGRACPNQAMTIVGDLAQGTRSWSPSSWDEVVSWIGARRPARRHELHINYRTPTEIMAWASPFSAAPGRAVAVRSTGVTPEAVPVDADALVPTVEERARRLRRRERRGDDRRHRRTASGRGAERTVHRPDRRAHTRIGEGARVRRRRRGRAGRPRRPRGRDPHRCTWRSPAPRVTWSWSTPDHCPPGYRPSEDGAAPARASAAACRNEASSSGLPNTA